MPVDLTLKAGDKAPVFQLQNANEENISLTDLLGKWVVLYFYPKDDTSGCTIEALEFTALKEAFNKRNAVVLGVSPDTCSRHRKFTDKHDLDVLLLADLEKVVLEAYGVWQEKSMYGRKYMGVIRSTILINPEGEIAHVWQKVKPKNHAQEVLETLDAQ